MPILDWHQGCIAYSQISSTEICHETIQAFCRVACFCAFLLLFASPVSASLTGSIVGSVKDQTASPHFA